LAGVVREVGRMRGGRGRGAGCGRGFGEREDGAGERGLRGVHNGCVEVNGLWRVQKDRRWKGGVDDSRAERSLLSRRGAEKLNRQEAKTPRGGGERLGGFPRAPACQSPDHSWFQHAAIISWGVGILGRNGR
jgi:hypothetical protein